MYRIFLALLMLGLAQSGAQAQAGGPFARMAGQWTGTGTIELSDGNRESLRCRAAYNVLGEGRSLQLNIRCASESYNFDLRAGANYAGGRVNGTWSESTLSTGGSLAGTASGDHVRVLASSPAFTASLTLTTRGSRQTVSIRSQQPDSKVQGASINLHRG
jgi:hypothetical protein